MTSTIEAYIARWFRMSDDVWARHSNPWSVYTRFTALPLIALAIWSRVWLGWWSLAAIAAALAWTWFNPRIFAKPRSTDNWASKGVFGERVWLNRKAVPVPAHHHLMPNLLNGVSAVGLIFLIWGLWRLEIWPTLVGHILVIGGKLWFVDRMAWLYEDMKDADPTYRSWLRPRRTDND